MAEDATLYFLVIFTSHFTLEMTLIFASVRTSSRRLVYFSFAETFVAYGKTSPWSVSDSATNTSFDCSLIHPSRYSGNVVYA